MAGQSSPQRCALRSVRMQTFFRPIKSKIPRWNLAFAGSRTRQRLARCGWRNPNPSLKSQGTHRPVQDGKTRKIKGSFAYSATKHRYTNIGIYLDNAL